MRAFVSLSHYELIIRADVINAMAFSPFISGFVTIDRENIIKTCSLCPTTLGKGHELFEPAGPIWVNFELLSQLLKMTYVLCRALRLQIITHN